MFQCSFRLLFKCILVPSWPIVLQCICPVFSGGLVHFRQRFMSFLGWYLLCLNSGSASFEGPSLCGPRRWVLGRDLVNPINRCENGSRAFGAFPGCVTLTWWFLPPRPTKVMIYATRCRHFLSFFFIFLGVQRIVAMHPPKNLGGKHSYIKKHFFFLIFFMYVCFYVLFVCILVPSPCWKKQYRPSPNHNIFWSPARPAYVVFWCWFWCWSMLVFPTGLGQMFSGVFVHYSVVV